MYFEINHMQWGPNASALEKVYDLNKIDQYAVFIVNTKYNG